MGRTLLKIISGGVLAGLVLLAAPAHAKDVYVKYSEFRSKFEAKTEDPDAIGVEELRGLEQAHTPFILFDARTRSEFNRSHIAGARLPAPEEYYTQQELFNQKIVPSPPSLSVALPGSVGAMPRDSRIVTYCHRHCGLSKSLMVELKHLGFTNVRWLDGGIDSWQEKGYPLEVQNP